MVEKYTPKHLSHKITRKGPGAGAAALVLSFALLAVLIGAAFARYQHQFKPEGSVKAKDFYFTSDLLDGGAHTLAPGSEEVTFTLSNHADELRWSEVEIAYDVTVIPADGETGSGATVHYTNAEKKLAPDEKRDDTVTIQNLAPGTYTIEAKGTGGYEKTLTATVEVLPVGSVVYKYLDTTNSEYVLLTVWAQGYTGNVTIMPPPTAGLIPDNTDPVMGAVKTNETITDTTSFNTDGYASHTYRFFGGGVTAEQFTVTYYLGDGSSKTAEVKTPS